MNKDYTKLPKWARQDIQKLEADINYYKKKLENLEGKPSNVSYQIMLEKSHYLPENSCVEFHLKHKHYQDSGIRVSHKYQDNNTVRIETINGVLKIRPVASNVIEAQIERL